MRSLTLLPLLLILAACASTQDSADSASEIPTPIEPQIAKDINKAFLDKDLDVGDFTKRFEGESREVF
ncbi:MAG: hypothetical protein ACI835_006004, partial [Planctomycetota bacterium]